MSELTPCNACSLNSMRSRAARRGAQITVRRLPVSEEMGGWYEVRASDEDEPCAYFMELTVECCC